MLKYYTSLTGLTFTNYRRHLIDLFQHPAKLLIQKHLLNGEGVSGNVATRPFSTTICQRCAVKKINNLLR